MLHRGTIIGKHAYFGFIPDPEEEAPLYLARYVRVRVEPDLFAVDVRIVFALGKEPDKVEAPRVETVAAHALTRPVALPGALPPRPQRKYSWVRYGALLPRPAAPDDPVPFVPWIRPITPDAPAVATPLMQKLGISCLMVHSRQASAPTWEDVFLFATPRRMPPRAGGPEGFIYLRTYHRAAIEHTRFGITTLDLDGNEGPVVALERRTF